MVSSFKNEQNLHGLAENVLHYSVFNSTSVTFRKKENKEIFSENFNHKVHYEYYRRRSSEGGGGRGGKKEVEEEEWKKKIRRSGEGRRTRK